MAGGAAAFTPLLLLALLLSGVVPDPLWKGAHFHFYVVSFTAAIAVAMTVMLFIAARLLRDLQIFLLGLAFLGIAGIFLVHALTTPGVLVAGANPWTGFSARVSLLFGAACFALSTVRWADRIRSFVTGHQYSIVGVVVAALALYAGVAVSSSQVTGGEMSHSMQPAGRLSLLGSPAVSWGAAGLTLLLLGLTVARYGRMYRLTPLPLTGGFLLSSVLLMQSQIMMAIAPMWHASWWGYHVVMIAAFVAAVAGMLREYNGSRSLEAVAESLLLRDTISQLQRGYTEVILALVRAIEEKDRYTLGHTERVAELSVLIGEELRLPPEKLRVLNEAAMLHDIGKIGIPDAILNKPGPLTAEERRLVEEHSRRGEHILRELRSLQAHISGVRSHHERMDGSGYPDGLHGEEIPLDARIIAVADVFDALTSTRSYRPAWALDRALDLIDSEAGTKLDPAAAEALHKALPRWSGYSRLATRAAQPEAAGVEQRAAGRSTAA